VLHTLIYQNRIRRERGMIHLTFLVFVLLLLVIAVFNRHAIQQQIDVWVQQATTRISHVLTNVENRVAGTLDNFMHGNFSFDSGGVMVNDGALDDLFTEQPDFATMARTLPRRETLPPPTPAKIQHGITPLCQPLLPQNGQTQQPTTACSLAPNTTAPCTQGQICTPVKTQ
jgi:hypothetical protein